MAERETAACVFKRKPAPISAPEKPLQPQDAAALLQRVVAFYSKTFRKDRKGQDYLTGRKLSGSGVVRRVPSRLQQRDVAQGAAQVGRNYPGLENLGRVERSRPGTLSRLRHRADF